MAKVYWDTMLFVYFLEGDPAWGPRVESIFRRHIQRGDELCTAHFTMGELLASPHFTDAQLKSTEEQFQLLGVSMIPLEAKAARIFGLIRRSQKLSVADSVHLSCAAAYGVDLFLTADKSLLKARAPGIHFIADLNNNIL